MEMVESYSTDPASRTDQIREYRACQQFPSEDFEYIQCKHPTDPRTHSPLSG
ncbi:hypothetical protein BJX96DRAFT_150403 [Aspergillus floccosus]